MSYVLFHPVSVVNIELIFVLWECYSETRMALSSSKHVPPPSLDNKLFILCQKHPGKDHTFLAQNLVWTFRALSYTTTHRDKGRD